MWKERIFLTCADTRLVSVVSTGDTCLTENETFIGTVSSLELNTKENPNNMTNLHVVLCRDPAAMLYNLTFCFNSAK